MIQQILPLLALMVLCGGCTATKDTIAAGIGGTVLLAQAPTNEIEQIYYLGVFDPQEQVPPTVYRVRVHGQASAISFMRFASGWVPADVIDSLGTNVEFQEAGAALTIEDEKKLSEALPAGRKLVLFGPEGFRQAPKNHRLVIVMGSSPEKFFQAIDTSLGIVPEVKAKQRSTKLQQNVLAALAELGNERRRLDEVATVVESDSDESKETRP
jgi:hypothetical protein